MSGVSRLVTKSVRLSPEEDALITQISDREHLAVGTLLRKWVLDALARARLDQAITEYEEGEMNLGEAAVRAGVTVERMMAELDRRGIDTITTSHFRASLDHLSQRFGASDALRAVLAESGQGTDRKTAP